MKYKSGNIEAYISDCDGIMTISDVHGEFELMMRAVNFAKTQNLHIVFLGDITDGIGKDPLACLQTVRDLLFSEQATFIVGNHDDKLHRWAIGNKVKINDYLQDTIDSFGPYVEDAKSYIKQIMAHENTHYIARYKEYYFTHGAVKKSAWDDFSVSNSVKSMCLYGETNGEREPNKFTDKVANVIGWMKAKVRGQEFKPRLGFPVRLYDWIDDIPFDKVAIVGHDRRPKGVGLVKRKQPIHMFGKEGGIAIFTDCGAGKNEDGGIGSIVIDFTQDMFKDTIGHRYPFYFGR